MVEDNAPLSFREKLSYILWESRLSLIIICSILLILIMTLPNIGVLIAILFVLAASLIGKKDKSFQKLGFKKQTSWCKTILTAFVIAFIVQTSFHIVFDPMIEKLTGHPIDLSSLDSMRGNFVNYLLWLLIGWGIGGFLEEITFRGYMITRLAKAIGDTSAKLVVIVLVTSTAFGLAHLYQDVSGMISTGAFAVIFGIVFIKSKYNLWMPIFVHGFCNMVSITYIYLNWDKTLAKLLF